MSTKLCVRLTSAKHSESTETEFFYAEEWTADAEAEMLQKLHEVLRTARSDIINFRLQVELQVSDPNQTHFMITRHLHHGQNATGIHKLSIREIEILGFIMKGHTNHAIAEKLFISYETVKTHRKNILAKTGTHNTASLIQYYHETFFDKSE
jgi:DNA-binding NarL/FixJ family response regulator